MSFYFVLCSFVLEATICQSVSSHVKRVLSEYRKYACLLKKKMVDLLRGIHDCLRAFVGLPPPSIQVTVKILPKSSQNGRAKMGRATKQNKKIGFLFC